MQRISCVNAKTTLSHLPINLHGQAVAGASEKKASCDLDWLCTSLPLLLLVLTFIQCIQELCELLTGHHK